MIRHAVLLLSLSAASACTSTLVGKKASADGSVFASHSNDGGATTDPRLVRIPSVSFTAGATRAVWLDHLAYPRYVGTARGDIPAYAPEGNQTASAPIGFIPQPQGSGATYTYLEDTYGAQVSSRSSGFVREHVPVRALLRDVKGEQQQLRSRPVACCCVACCCVVCRVCAGWTNGRTALAGCS